MLKENNKEQEIMQEAEALFLEKGFNRATTTEIAKRAGCNQALVHYYFRTKEKLFEDIFYKKLEIFISSFLTQDQSTLSFEEKLAHKIESHFDILLNNPKLPYLVMSEMISNPERIKSFKSILSGQFFVFKQFLSDLETEIKAGRIRDISPVDILFNSLALNLSVFLMKPITMELLSLDEKGFKEFALKRKKENVLCVINSLKTK